MSKRSESHSSLPDQVGELPGISRRQLLQATATAVGGAAILVAAAVPAEAKMQQSAAGYQDKPKGDQSCANCALFKAPASCTLVDGTISPTGWCRFYSKKSS